MKSMTSLAVPQEYFIFKREMQCHSCCLRQCLFPGFFLNVLFKKLNQKLSSIISDEQCSMLIMVMQLQHLNKPTSALLTRLGSYRELLSSKNLIQCKFRLSCFHQSKRKSNFFALIYSDLLASSYRPRKIISYFQFAWLVILPLIYLKGDTDGQVYKKQLKHLLLYQVHFCSKQPIKAGMQTP